MPISSLDVNGYLYLLLLVVVCQVADSAKSMYDEPRLPVAVVPFHYDLMLITHLENATSSRYEGTVDIFLYVQKATDQVVLNVGGVWVETRNISLHKSEGLQLKKVQFNKGRQYMILTYNKRLTTGRTYVLNIQFGRPLKERSTDGYFIGLYSNGRTWQKNLYSMAIFERNLIRNTIPSFDEPALRATFNVTMGHHKRFQSFSNMNVRTILPNRDLPDYVWSVHEATPAIPTYQLAFSVNNFTCSFSQSVSTNPVHFRTCSRKALPETTFAANVAPQLLQFFEELLQVRLPLDKIDQLIVEKIPGPAMDNLGFVFYRSKEMLQRYEGPMTRPKMLALQLVAHEMAHMWFGSLLGFDSWSDLWLSEGLTGYFEALGVDHIQPGVGRRLLLSFREMAFMHEGQVGGMAVAPVIPIERTGSSEAPLFKKANALVNMLIGFLGNVSFYDGIQRHLWQNSFASSSPNHLWRSLQLARERQAGNLSSIEPGVTSVMDTWTQQEGYPLVTVTRNGTTVILTQSHALNASRSERWWIPITFTVQSEYNFVDTQPKAWMSPLEERLQLSVSVREDRWILFNWRATSYYRVQYDDRTWEQLAATLFDDFRSIHVLGRAQIVSDVLFLRKHGRISWATALNVLKYIVDEDEHEPLTAFVLGVTHDYWGFKPENSMFIAKWLGIAGKWYAEFISHTFDKFVLQQNLNSLR